MSIPQTDRRTPESCAEGFRSPSRAAPTLAAASIGMGIPITAITLGTTGGGAAGIVAMLISWAGIAAVNLVHARRYRRLSVNDLPGSPGHNPHPTRVPLIPF